MSWSSEGGNVTARILRRDTPMDVYGDRPTPDPTYIPIPNPLVAPALSGVASGSAEVHGRGRAGVRDGLRLLIRERIDIRHTDQVEVDGVIYDIEGPPEAWIRRGGEWSGWDVELRRAAG